MHLMDQLLSVCVCCLLVAFAKVVVSEGSDGSIDAGTTSPRQEEDMSAVPPGHPLPAMGEDPPSSPPSSSPSPSMAVLPDRPLQLVRPDPHYHQSMELVQENLRHLHQVKEGVAVVAVVGKFHSGKSFLLNQLMGKQDGFGIGPTIKPQTMGIWMWGKPMSMQLPSGDPLSVIFLDTEGFAASNISESYDAKVFSVATLLSSYLIYNSVKIIDQSDIDYLELLARRTQLFALRSQLSRSHWMEEFNHDLLKFPPLLWVVQDFVQLTEDGETPQQWLHRIMGTSSREDGKHDISLLGIFEKVDCHTLFLPATKKTLLQDLSKAKEDELTEEYRAERDAMVSLLRNNLIPKEKNGQPITGPELAALLEILVKAANEGSLAEIPGRWELFIEELRIGAMEDCLTYYESDMNLLLSKHKDGVVNETELKEWHKNARDKAKQLITKLLLGLETASEEAMESMLKGTEEKFEMIWDINDKKIQLRCSEVQQKIEIDAEEALQKVTFPTKTNVLEEIQAEVKAKCLRSYNVEVGFLSDNTAFQRHLQRLETGLDYIFKAVTLKNNEAIEKKLKESIEIAIDHFLEASKNHNRIPRTTAVFNTVMEAASDGAKQVFESSSGFAREESLYRPYFGLLLERVKEKVEANRDVNLQLVENVCHSTVQELVGNFRHNTGPSKMVLPLNNTELESRLNKEKAVAFKNYVEIQAMFSDTSAYSEMRDLLSKELDKICKDRENENYKAYMKEVDAPLKTSLKLINLSEDKYDTEYSLYEYMKEVCLLNLDEGKAKHWQRTLKLTIVEKFIQESSELQRLLATRRGLYSSIKGFFQWLLSFIS